MTLITNIRKEQDKLLFDYTTVDKGEKVTRTTELLPEFTDMNGDVQVIDPHNPQFHALKLAQYKIEAERKAWENLTPQERREIGKPLT